MIAVLAGVFSCFPNVGMNHAESLKVAAVGLGASPAMAGNAAWALLFTAGFLLNFGYCLGLMVRSGNLGALANDFGRNLGWIALMAAMWIGSFYLYGMGAAHGQMGRHCGLAAVYLVGHSGGQPLGPVARRMAQREAVGPRALNLGLVVLLVAVAVFGAASALKAPDQPMSETPAVQISK